MISGHSPARLSPLHHAHISLDAQIGDIDGWQMPVSYGDPDREELAIRDAVGICDITGRTVLRVKSSRLEGAPAVGNVALSDGATMARLTDEQMLVIGTAEAVGDWRAISADDAISGLHLIDVTSGIASLKIAGPKSRDVLAAMTDIDLRDRTTPNLTCIQAGFAGVHGTLLRIDIGSTLAYELLVSREFAEYAWHTALESLPQGDVTPVGTEALEIIRHSSI
ncbi:MAG: hypothetical protein HQ478_00435 [Chloroflexi bacterium]|nr:hypothetical protein [Chloroflexota bacterium]